MLEALMMRPTANKGPVTEIPASELINAAELRTLTGLTTGNVYMAEPVWLEIPYKGKMFYVAKTMVFSSVTWNTLNSLKLTTGVDKVIKGKTYTVRSLQGVITNGMFHPSNIPAASQTNNTEWNDIMLTLLYTQLKYTLASLGFTSGLGYEWARESGSWHNSFYNQTYQCGVVRGSSSPTGANLSGNTGLQAWRPILVLVE